MWATKPLRTDISLMGRIPAKRPMCSSTGDDSSNGGRCLGQAVGHNWPCPTGRPQRRRNALSQGPLPSCGAVQTTEGTVIENAEKCRVSSAGVRKGVKIAGSCCMMISDLALFMKGSADVDQRKIILGD